MNLWYGVTPSPSCAAPVSHTCESSLLPLSSSDVTAPPPPPAGLVAAYGDAGAGPRVGRAEGGEVGRAVAVVVVVVVEGEEPGTTRETN